MAMSAGPFPETDGKIGASGRGLLEALGMLEQAYGFVVLSDGEKRFAARELHLRSFG